MTVSRSAGEPSLSSAVSFSSVVIEDPAMHDSRAFGSSLHVCTSYLC